MSVESASPLASYTVFPSLVTIVVVPLSEECEKSNIVWAVLATKIALLAACLVRFREHARYSVVHAAVPLSAMLGYYVLQDITTAYGCDVRYRTVVTAVVLATGAFACVAALDVDRRKTFALRSGRGVLTRGV